MTVWYTAAAREWIERSASLGIEADAGSYREAEERIALLSDRCWSKFDLAAVAASP